ncbi:HAD family hydrolase [Leucobacter sp. M11]|uniref:HAD family hydrolase n=1 Tax=Leucobacter sp. M11 TaxID=2993565 RepID=UPI002D7F6AD6|nr:HAD family hydrolase [Leucobacter sp. M11]MEB4614728.1 HAD family hydrolase [Leucobacter sp. M11]
MTRSLVALDLDGTVLHHDGAIDERLAGHIRALFAAGHEIIVSTGRSAGSTLPVIERLGIRPAWVVCANGAVVLKRDALAERAYRREYVETFDTTDVLSRISTHLVTARYAVEDGDGLFRYTDEIPDTTLLGAKKQVPFGELLGVQATRVVVFSPDHRLEDFLDIVEEMGLHHVSYSIGWTAWLDIAPEGVTKASALERLRGMLGIDRSRVIAAGDGRNDIEMLTWAGRHGHAIAMGQGPAEVQAAATEVTGTVEEGGLTAALEARFPELLAR